MRQEEEELREAARDKEGARVKVERATGKMVATSLQGRHQGRQTTPGATGAGRWSTRAWNALATRGTGSKGDTSREGISHGSKGPSKGGSARVEEEDTRLEEEATSASRDSRAAPAPWSGCSNKRQEAGWR